MRNEHHEALANQARAIRLAAATLETIGKSETPLDNPNSMERVVVSRKLGEIRANLDALLARFGRSDR